MNSATAWRGEQRPWDCSTSCFAKRSAHLSQMQMWHRDRYTLTHFSLCSPIYEYSPKDDWERDPYFHHQLLLYNTWVRGPCLLSGKSQKSLPRNLYQEHRASVHKSKTLPSLFILRTSKEPPELLQKSLSSPLLSDTFLFRRMTRNNSQNF